MNPMKKVLLFSLLLTGCTAASDRNTIESLLTKHDWKYGQGFNIGDWVDFKNTIYTVESDTILLGDSAIATVKKIEIGRFGDDDEMHITSIHGEKTGIYHSK